MNLSEVIVEVAAPTSITEDLWLQQQAPAPIPRSIGIPILWEEQVAGIADITFAKQRTLMETAREAGSMLAWGAAALCLSKKNKLTHTVATAALDYLTEFYAVPERFAAGFEQELGHRARLSVYGVLATTLRTS